MPIKRSWVDRDSVAGCGPFDDQMLQLRNLLREVRGEPPYASVEEYRAAALAEHAMRTASPMARRRHERDMQALLAVARARNDQLEAEIRTEVARGSR